VGKKGGGEEGWGRKKEALNSGDDGRGIFA